MIRWLHVTLVAVSVAVLVLVILVILKRLFLTRTCKNFDAADADGGRSLQTGITGLHQVSPHKTNRYGPFRPTEQAFRWTEHPSLIIDAVENGWSQFAFTDLVSQLPSLKSVSNGKPGNQPRVEIGWEVCEGSADSMQKVRLNPSMKKITTTVMAVRAALPLPGPNLGNSSFPQEAYFEVKILSWNGYGFDHSFSNIAKPGDKIKLIGEDFNDRKSSNLLSHHVRRKTTGGILSVGLTRGGPVILEVPGSYPGSVGFNANGSLYSDGTKLVCESKDTWGRPGSVVGCGYNPSQKKVFFTVDSQLVHEIYCKTGDFGSPLYPVLAANIDLTVLVNHGQSPFKYAPANLQRTPNPCFLQALANSPSLGYEDSKELFSIGRIDPQWLQRSVARSNNNTVNSIKDIQLDQESDGDLFEIVLESIGRSPHTTPYQ